MSAKATVQSEEALVEMWETLVRNDATVRSGGISQTIAHKPPVQTFERQTTLGALPRIDPEADLSEFKVAHTLGQGGMGLVRLARQTSLYRDVAIKTILPDHLDNHATYDLLQESWITGMLEHPNIIPIHALGIDEHGAPMLVMKRVEGVSWLEVLAGKEDLPAAFRDGRDRLENHLHILVQVCNAVQFAHSKSIIHCDLKPSNVMLGEYGEVYLLDWGIAVSLIDDGSGRLPLAEELDGVAGTPAYIAPELARGEGPRIDRRTDVYLLGSILHELVTHTPRHQGDSVVATLINAHHSEPVDYDDAVPPEVAYICNKATSADPALRYQDVEGFRQAVVDFLRHRDSLRLSGESHSRLGLLEHILASEEVAAGHAHADNVAARAYRLFNECRFGFEQALSIWRDNEEARRGLHRSLEQMIEFELRQRDAKAAALLIDELPSERPNFERRLATLRGELAEEAEEIERNRAISHAVDLDLASAARSKMCVFLGLLFGGVPFINHWAVEQGFATLTFKDYFIQFAVIFIGAGLVVGLMRERLLKNSINARIILSVFVILGGCLIMRLLGFSLGLEPAGCIALENGLLAFSMLMMATSFDRQMWPAALAFLAGAFGGAHYPDHILQFDGASNAAALWILAVAWRERASKRDASDA